MIETIPCPECQGSGITYNIDGEEVDCAECEGSGEVDPDDYTDDEAELPEL